LLKTLASAPARLETAIANPSPAVVRAEKLLDAVAAASLGATTAGRAAVVRLEQAKVPDLAARWRS